MGVLLAALLATSIVMSNLRGAGLLPAAGARQSAFVRITRVPDCTALTGEMTLLMAQSVPTASRVPCLSSIPLGWEFNGLEVRRGSSLLLLESDRARSEPVEVTLRESCDVRGATEVPTDEVGTRRFEAIQTLEGRYAGTRYYVFEGGCVTYEFDFIGEGRTALANEASIALSFVTRDELARTLYEKTGLRL